MDKNACMCPGRPRPTTKDTTSPPEGAETAPGDQLLKPEQVPARWCGWSDVQSALQEEEEKEEEKEEKEEEKEDAKPTPGASRVHVCWPEEVWSS